MMNWLLRNLSLLATLLVLAIAALAGSMLLPLLLRLSPQILAAELDFWSIVVGLGLLLYAAIFVLGIILAYGLVLRFLSLCDDVASIRRAYDHRIAKPD